MTIDDEKKILKEPILPSNHLDYDKESLEISSSISIFDILRIKEPLDFIYMFFGFLAAIVTGASIPTFNVLMGQLINEINDENTGFGSSITLLVHALLALALINLCSGTIQVRSNLVTSSEIKNRYIVGHVMVRDKLID